MQGTSVVSRSLLLVAGCAFVASLMCFAIVLALGPVDWNDWNWDTDHGPRRRGPPIEASGPTVTRTLRWSGADDLRVNLPADVTYTQGPENTVVVTGPQTAVEHVTVDDETIRFDRRVRRAGRLKIVVTAPDVSEFSLNGSQRLNIENYDQDQLEVSLNGSGDVVGRGRAREVEVHINGSGDVDLGGVPADGAEVHINGSGKTILSPKLSAEIHIAGSGDVILTTNPPHLEQHIAGAGRIVQGQAPTPPVPPIPPTPPVPAA